MPRIRNVLIMTFLLFSPLFASSWDSLDMMDRFSNLRYRAMGSTGVAASEAEGTFALNPALLFKSESNRFSVGTRYGETFFSGDDSIDPIPWITQPEASLDLHFSNRYVALSIGLGNVLVREQLDPGDSYPTDREIYTANNLSRIQLTGSYGWRSITFGLYASVGTATGRNVEIRKERPLFDYISRTYLERYDSSGATGGDFSSGLGILISYPWISIGLLSTSLFTIEEETNRLVLDVTDIFNGVAVGIAANTPKFSRNNELNPLVILAMADFTDLGAEEDRSFRFGVEAKVQFLSDLWVALRGGYREKRPLDESLFAIRGTGEITSGIGGRFGDVGTDIVVTIPLSNESVRITMGVAWKF